MSTKLQRNNTDRVGAALVKESKLIETASTAGATGRLIRRSIRSQIAAQTAPGCDIRVMTAIRPGIRDPVDGIIYISNRAHERQEVLTAIGSRVFLNVQHGRKEKEKQKPQFVDARESQTRRRRRRRQGDGSGRRDLPLLPPGRLPVSSRRPAEDLEVTYTTSNRFTR